jgi:hypothetical protein
VNPVELLFLRPVLKYAMPLLFLLPLVVLIAFEAHRGAEILEGELVLMGALFAAGLRSSLSSDRMEYVLTLPLTRERATRIADGSALVPLVALALLTCACDASGFPSYVVELLGRWVSTPSRRAVLEAHPERLAWLNVIGLPILAYWVTTWIVGVLRLVSSQWRVSTAYWVPFCLLALNVIALWFSLFEVEPRPPHDLLARNMPGLAALLLAWPLARHLRSRPLSLGIQGFPEDGASWDS